MLSDLERGWLAGIFEGEGSTGNYGRGVTVYIAMTDLDVLLRVQELFPSPNSIITRERRDGRKTLYAWRIRQRDLVAEFLTLILPLLGERRKLQARPVLRRATDPQGGLGSGHRRKTHCRNGHRYDEQNTHIDARGHRNCRICRRESTRRLRATKS